MRLAITLLAMLALSLALVASSGGAAEAAATDLQPYGQKVICHAKYGTNGGSVVKVVTGMFVDSYGRLFSTNVNHLYWIAIADYYSGSLVWSSGWRVGGLPTLTPFGLPYSGRFNVYVYTAWQNPGSSKWVTNGFVHLATCPN